VILHLVAGARPNFMKIAPLHAALSERGASPRIIHTGQHYDERMSDVFFRQLGLPEPHVNLGVGSDTHARQTAAIMIAYEEVLERERPDGVVVVGDVNSTVACALVATKLHLPVAHVEAGLRSGDRRMPEEINRILTDRLADLLFVTETSGVENLRREGVEEERIHLVGNVMIDTLVRLRPKARKTGTVERLRLDRGGYALATFHRPSNVDDPARLATLAEILGAVGERLPLVFPAHPRTRERFMDAGLLADLEARRGVRFLEPLGYLEFLDLMEHARLVLTDSGGIQEETTFLGVPCLTARESTERPATLTHGTNRLVPLDRSAVLDLVDRLVEDAPVRGDGAAEVRVDHGAGSDDRRGVPPLWDGRAAQRIADILLSRRGRDD